MPGESAKKFFDFAKSFKGVVAAHDPELYDNAVTISGDPVKVKALSKALTLEAERIRNRRNDFFKEVHESNRRIGEADPEGPTRINVEVTEETLPRESLFDKAVKKLVFKFKYA